MAFEDALQDVAEKVREFGPTLTTEEATKTAIIMPFISRVLGYDVFNPQEVVPEYVADLGLKKGEKVDFAIVRDGQVQMLIEAKRIGDSLTLDHAGQLVRYFHTSNARIGVLTNGQHWHFFTDLDKPNRMDEKPFLQLDLTNIDPYVLPELKKMTKDTFNLESVIDAAGELKYVSALKRALGDQFEAPSDDLVKLLGSRVYEGMFTQKMRELFTRLTAKALTQFINDRVNDRLKSALGGAAPAVGAAPNSEAPQTDTDAADEAGSEIETTLVELEGFRIVRAIAASEVTYSRVVGRDQQSYFAVILDDNNRKPICRLHFNRKQLYLGLLDENKVEHREAIDRVEDIYLHAHEIRAAVARYK
jgi:predicted type IV restriction endonuclease